jgi:two-component system, cell cycle sensor histidine kinase and response regulator CckA
VIHPLKVLHLEDNPADTDLVRATLAREHVDCNIDRVMTKDAFETALRSKSYDIIVSDFSLPGFDGLTALSIAQSLKPEIPFIFLSGTIGEERAVESLKQGAADYVVKDRMQRLASAITRARNDAAQRQQRLDDEEQIRRQAELLNQAKDAIFIHNAREEITYWNKSAERIYGWTAGEVVGKTVSRILYPSDSGISEEIRKAILEKGEWTGELTHLTKAGKEIVVSNHRTLLRDASGLPIGDLNINSDITEKKELEAQVLRSQRMDSIGALAGGIAHDLNNMLAPILMATELLRHELADEQHVRMVDVASKSAKRGADLVKQILQFSRGGPKSGLVNLESLEQDLVRFISKTFPPAITIKSDVDWQLYPIDGNATQLHQVLLNLCVNARDAMSDGGSLLISLKNRLFKNYVVAGSDQSISGPFVELSVSDTGPGIPPEIRDRIFDPFFTTKPHGKGTGLGLSTVAKIVRDHRGFIEVATGAGKGTTFRIFLPAAPEKTPKQPAPAPTNAPAGHGECILLVDDELALLEMTKELLEANNYKVLTATNGVDALQCFETNRDKIAIVVSDLLMPDMSGQDLIAAISKRDPQMLTICVSGSVEETTLFRKNEKGPTAFLRKPCSTTTLLEAVATLLKEGVFRHKRG